MKTNAGSSWNARYSIYKLLVCLRDLKISSYKSLPTRDEYMRFSFRWIKELDNED